MRPSPGRGAGRVTRCLAALIVLALAVRPALGADTSRLAGAKPMSGAPASIAVSYADLVDPDAVTRTGRKLTEALRDKGTPKAFLQPFLDGYSALLPYVVEMVFGPDPAPRRDVVERWPPGSPQPAWVALFRGRYRAVADGEGRVRLFLPGDDASAAWKKHYPVVRHCLAAVAEKAGAPLAVEIFAYRNDYRKQELRLSLLPATVAGDFFPPDRPPLDLSALVDFFRQGGQLEGARLDPGEGLVLYANPDRRDTLAGEPIDLSDLAVAYRAVFHAGDNDAFISLDPSADPARAAVNFGGFLEDTRLGAAVLAADRCFKTIGSGLDPITHRDVRREIRRRIPEFMTNSERAFLEKDTNAAPGWIASRYWFYPESVSVDADPREGFAVITRPRFTADAERIGKGFENLDGRKKRAALPPGVRENIRQINAEHDRYAAVFPEIGDLAAVARLMAVAAWLKRSETSQLDLDALLAVELPGVSTPRTLERMVSSEFLVAPSTAPITAALVKERSEVAWLGPLLQRTVGEIFPGPEAFGDYLCTVSAAGQRPCGEGGAEAEAEVRSLFEEQRSLPLRTILRTEEHLLSLLRFLLQKSAYPLTAEGETALARQIADKTRFNQLRDELGRVRAELAAAGDPPPEALVEERSRLEAEYGAIMKRYHEQGNAGPAWPARSRVQISGGISLRPGEFTIRKDAESKALKEFKRQAQSAAVAAGAGGGTGRLVRSRPTGKIAPVVAKGASPAPAAAGATRRPTPAATAPGAPSAAAKPAAPPKSNVPAATATTAPRGKGALSGGKPGAPPPAVARQSQTPALAASRIAVPAGAAGAARAVGELVADGRIVFRKAP